MFVPGGAKMSALAVNAFLKNDAMELKICSPGQNLTIVVDF